MARLDVETSEWFDYSNLWERFMLPKLYTTANGLLRYLLSVLSTSKVISSATFLVTLRCNSSCAYCDFPRNAVEREMTKEEAIALINALRQHGLFRLGISGGEPLLRDDFGAIAAHVKRLGILSSLTTNGYLLEEKADEAMLFDFVLCGLDGDEKVHDTYRGKGSFKAAIRGLQMLRSKGHKRLGLIVPIHAFNMHVLEEVLRIAEFLGALAFFQPVQKRDSWVGPDFHGLCTQDELREVFNKIADWKRQGRPVGNSFGHIGLVCAGDTRKMGAQCHAGRYFFTILPDGGLIPCCLWPFRGQPRIAPNNIQEVLKRVEKKKCRGCTIVSYYENTRLMRGSFQALREALHWSIGRNHA